MGADILNISKLLCIITGEAGKEFSQVYRQKCVIIYMNGAFYKTPINMDNNACNVTGVLHSHFYISYISYYKDLNTHDV